MYIHMFGPGKSQQPYHLKGWGHSSWAAPPSGGLGAEGALPFCRVLGLQEGYGGLPKIRASYLGVPIIRTLVFWGLFWGPPILGNSHIEPYQGYARLYCLDEVQM